MKFIEETGKTVEEAIDLGLKKLNKTRDQVEINVLEFPNKGFLGIIGTKLAKVRLTVTKRAEDDAQVFLEDLFKSMDLQVKIDIKKENNTLLINLEGENMGVVIGKRGQTLDSIQYLLSLVVNKDSDKYIKVFIDTENYRKRREETLIRLANKISNKVRKTKKTVALEPMNPYERRIIHSSLQNNPYVETHSEGKEPFRKVVIQLKK